MRIMQIPLVAALSLGGVALLSTPAEAAAKTCTPGQWIMTSHKGSVAGTNPDGGTVKITWTGAAGTKLTLSGTTATYDFAKAKREYHTETFDGETAKQRTTYRKTLKVKTKFTGSAKGAFDMRENTAKGKATLQLTYTAPKHKKYAPISLAKAIRGGIFDSPVITDGTFTCTKSRLVLTRKEKTDTDTLSHQAIFRRA